MMPIDPRMLLVLVPAAVDFLHLHASPLKCNMVPHLIHKSQLLGQAPLLSNQVATLLRREVIQWTLQFTIGVGRLLWSHFRG